MATTDTAATELGKLPAGKIRTRTSVCEIRAVGAERTALFGTDARCGFGDEQAQSKDGTCTVRDVNQAGGNDKTVRLIEASVKGVSEITDGVDIDSFKLLRLPYALSTSVDLKSGHYRLIPTGSTYSGVITGIEQTHRKRWAVGTVIGADSATAR